MYDEKSRSTLKDKLKYEQKLIEIIVSSTSILESAKETVVYDGEIYSHQMQFKSDMCQHVRIEIIESVMPVIFISTFKMLDVIFEWILDENLMNGKKLTNNKRKTISQVPFRFIDKINLLKENDSLLCYPFNHQNEIFLKDYLLSLYGNLRGFRNEIVHGDSFYVSNRILSVNDTKNNNKIDITMNELEAFMRFLINTSKLLTGEESLDKLNENQIKYCLNIIKELHKLSTFNNVNYKFLNVVLKVPKENNSFTVDIRKIKEHLKTENSLGIGVLFDLQIIGLVNNEPPICWHFPIDYVPKKDKIYLPSDTYKKFQRPCKAEGI